MSNLFFMRVPLPALVLALAFGLSAHGAIPKRSTGTAVALQQAPQLDGHVATDPAWRGVAALTHFKQLQPDNGHAATQRTEVYVGFTADALYVAAICFEEDPSKIIVANDGFASDSFTFVLDTFRNAQTALVFGTNPAGAQYDGQTNNGYPDWNWSTVWEVRARKHEGGWSAEFEIPFTSLRYPSAAPDEAQAWGVNFSRVIRRNNEFAYWSPVPKQLSMYRLDLAGVVDGLRLPAQRRNLQFVPYALAGLMQPQDAASSRTQDVGFDVKYSLTPSLTLDFTYNTDFAQAESDRQQVNFGRFSPFFPETRPFFLENAGLFKVGSSEALLFHSRRIGIAGDGQRVPIKGGVRVSGKVGQTTNVGVLHMYTGADSAAAGKADFTVLRLSQDLPNRSSIGFIGTNRSAEDDRQTYGIDGRVSLGDYAMLSGFVAAAKRPGDVQDNHALSLFGRYDSPAWAYSAGYSEVGAGFNPAVGFVSRRDFRRFNTFVQHTKQMEGKWNLGEWKPHASYRGYWNFDGFYESGVVHVNSWFVWRNGADMWTAIDFVHEGVQEPFSVAGAMVPAGEYDHPRINAGINSPTGKPFRLGLFANIGGYYGGERTSASPFLSYRKDETLTATFSWRYNRIDLPSAEDPFDVNLVQAKLRYSFTPKVGVQTLVQYNDANHVVAANVRFSWQRSANSGLYLVYSDINDRSDVPLHSRREIAVKYSYIFNVL